MDMASQAAAFHVAAAASKVPDAPTLPSIRIENYLFKAVQNGVRTVLSGKPTPHLAQFRAAATLWLHDVAMALHAVATSDGGGAAAAFRDARARFGEPATSPAMQQLRVFLEQPEALPGVVLFVMCTVLGVRQLDGVTVPTASDWQVDVQLCPRALAEVTASTAIGTVGFAGGVPARLAAFVRQAHAQVLFQICESMVFFARHAVVEAPIFAAYADALTAAVIEAAEGLAAKPPVNTMTTPWVHRSDAAQLLVAVDAAAHDWDTDDQRPVANTIEDALTWKWLLRIGDSYSELLLDSLSCLLCSDMLPVAGDTQLPFWLGCPRALSRYGMHVKLCVLISVGAADLLYKRCGIAGLLSDGDMAGVGVGQDLMTWANCTDGTPTEQIVRRALRMECKLRHLHRRAPADADIDVHGDGRLRVAVRQAVTTCVGDGAGAGGGAAGAGDGSSNLKRQRVGSPTDDEHAAMQVLSFMAANPVLCIGEDGTHTELLENVLGCL